MCREAQAMDRHIRLARVALPTSLVTASKASRQCSQALSSPPTAAPSTVKGPSEVAGSPLSLQMDNEQLCKEGNAEKRFSFQKKHYLSQAWTAGTCTDYYC